MNLRPLAVGLLRPEAVSPSLAAFVLLMLSTVTFDGISVTPAWADFKGSLQALLPGENGPQSAIAGSAEVLIFSRLVHEYLPHILQADGPDQRKSAFRRDLGSNLRVLPRPHRLGFPSEPLSVLPADSGTAYHPSRIRSVRICLESSRHTRLLAQLQHHRSPVRLAHGGDHHSAGTHHCRISRGRASPCGHLETGRSLFEASIRC